MPCAKEPSTAHLLELVQEILQICRDIKGDVYDILGIANGESTEEGPSDAEYTD